MESGPGDKSSLRSKKRRVLKSKANLPDWELEKAAAECEDLHSKSQSSNKQNLSDKPILPPCRVCEDKASGFHYGVNSCEACKGFFRRSLSIKMKYTCTENGSCVVNAFSRSCSYCRYQKCLRVGMSKHAIKIGRYTLEKKNRDIDEVNHLLKKPPPPTFPANVNIIYLDAACPSPSLLSPLSVAVPMTPSPGDHNAADGVDNLSTLNGENMQDITLMLPTPPFHASETTDLLNCSDGDLNLSPRPASEVQDSPMCRKCAEIARDSLHVTGVAGPACYSEEMRRTIAKLAEANILYNLYGPVIQNMDEVVLKQQQHYHDLGLKNQMFGELRTLSRDEYEAFYKATGIDLEDRLTTVSEVSKLLEDGARRLIKFAKAIPSFKDLSFYDQASLIKASRFEYFLLGAFYGMNAELEIGTMPDGRNYSLREIAGVCDYNFTKSMFQFADKLKKLCLVQDELAILKGICLTFSDRIPLDDPGEVDRIQWQLLNCFIAMLRHNHPRDHNLYTKVWDRLIELRSLNELNKKFTENLTMEWPEIKSCPLILEILTMC